MEILVQPLNRVIRVEPGGNLLHALQAAQIPMPCSCTAGRCVPPMAEAAMLVAHRKGIAAGHADADVFDARGF